MLAQLAVNNRELGQNNDAAVAITNLGYSDISTRQKHITNHSTTQSGFVQLTYNTCADHIVSLRSQNKRVLRPKLLQGWIFTVSKPCSDMILLGSPILHDLVLMMLILVAGFPKLGWWKIWPSTLRAADFVGWKQPSGADTTS